MTCNRECWDLHSQVARELAEIVRLAVTFDLPLPVEPVRMIHGVVIHPMQGDGPDWYRDCRKHVGPLTTAPG